MIWHSESMQKRRVETD